MKPIFILAFILFANCYTAFAGNLDIELSFPKLNYSIHEIVQLIQKETPYVIELPFADHSNARKSIPKQLNLEETLYWICRYFERHNQKRISFHIFKNQIQFQRASSIDSTKEQKLLASPIHLRGKNLRIHDVLPQVENQISKKVVLPFRDQKALIADYNYKCILEDFLEEIRIYFKSQSKIHLSYRISKNEIRFIPNGKVLKEPLHIDLISDLKAPLPKDDLISNFEEPKSKPISISKPSISPNDNKKQKRRITYPQKKSESNFQAQLNHISKIDISTFTTRTGLHSLLNQLIEPHQRTESFNLLLSRLEPHMNKAKGFSEWKSKLLALDQHKMGPYDKNSALQFLSEQWTSQILNYAKKSRYTKYHSPWSFSFKNEIGYGKGISKVGEHPAKPDKTGSGSWWHSSLSTQYNHCPRGPWEFLYGLEFDYTRSSGDSASLLEQGSFHLSFSGHRAVTQSSLRSYSPYVHYFYESDVFAADSFQSHDLLIIGNTFHWKEDKNVLGFDRSLADTDIFISLNFPKEEEHLDFIQKNDRSSRTIGFQHQYALVHAIDAGHHGPYFGLGLQHRSSDVENEKGPVYQIKPGYQYQHGSINLNTYLKYAWWSRATSVETLQVFGEAAHTFGVKNHRVYFNFEYENNQSDDSLADTQSSQVLLGVDLKW